VARNESEDVRQKNAAVVQAIEGLLAHAQSRSRWSENALDNVREAVIKSRDLVIRSEEHVPLLARSLRTTARLLLRRDRAVEALPHAQEAVAITRLMGGAPLIVSLACLAEVFEALHRYSDAAAAMNAADAARTTRDAQAGGEAEAVVYILGEMDRDHGGGTDIRSPGSLDVLDADTSPLEMYRHGVTAYENGDPRTAGEWWRRVADAGDADVSPRAMYRLGLLANEKTDVETARLWWDRAAESGHADVAPQAIRLLIGDVQAPTTFLEGILSSWLQEHLSDRPSAVIYLVDESGSSEVERAAVGVLRAFGMEVEQRLPEIRGSWLLRLRLAVRAWSGSDEAKALLAELEHAARVRLLHQPIAEVDEKKSAAVAALITALEPHQTAVVMLGSILILKVDGVLAVRDLSSRELAFMARNPGMVKDPVALLSGLDTVVGAERAVSPAAHEPGVEA
jgi:hypothetical protein